MKQEKSLSNLRHSAAHLLAQAVLELFPGTKLTIGPVTDDGFFYDFLPPENFKDGDLEKIENKMKELIKKDLPLEFKKIPKAEAYELYKDNKFKKELLDNIAEEEVGLSIQGEFHDLCKGGHIDSTGEIKHFKLLGISGAYWRADPDNDALQRINGTAFFSAEDLKQWEKNREEAAKYDHRKLGKELDLFSFQEEGTGFPFFHQKGQKVWQVLSEYLRKELEADGYKEVQTPIMMHDKLWKQSGHYAHYKENMYFSKVEKNNYALRPMNCPGGILIYKNRPRSYRELPFKLAEFGKVHRHELSGVLHGLFRVRAFTIDDAHIFCSPDQIEKEVLQVLNLAKRVYKKLGFENVKISLSTRPENSMGSDNLWKKATDSLKVALEKTKEKYEVDQGGGAFYGPKIDLHVKDSMGREWQLGTIQVDFFMPENFDLSYIAPSGKKERPVIVHRAIFGSFERLIGILVEHYKGKLPFWFAPVQARILTVTDDQKEYSQKIATQLKENNLRVEIDESGDPLSAQIKEAQLQNIPWMIIIGKKESEGNVITIRHLDGSQDKNLSIEQALEKADKLLK